MSNSTVGVRPVNQVDWSSAVLRDRFRSIAADFIGRGRKGRMASYSIEDLAAVGLAAVFDLAARGRASEEDVACFSFLRTVARTAILRFLHHDGAIVCRGMRLRPERVSDSGENVYSHRAVSDEMAEKNEDFDDLANVLGCHSSAVVRICRDREVDLATAVAMHIPDARESRGLTEAVVRNVLTAASRMTGRHSAVDLDDEIRRAVARVVVARQRLRRTCSAA